MNDIPPVCFGGPYVPPTRQHLKDVKHWALRASQHHHPLMAPRAFWVCDNIKVYDIFLAESPNRIDAAGDIVWLPLLKFTGLCQGCGIAMPKGTLDCWWMDNTMVWHERCLPPWRHGQIADTADLPALWRSVIADVAKVSKP